MSGPLRARDQSVAGPSGDWVKVATVAELRRSKKQLVDVAGTPVAVFYVDGSVYALRDVCIHKERNLHKGLIFQGKVICPGHQWAFDLATGWVDEWSKCQPSYPVRIDGDDVLVNTAPRVRTTPPSPEERWRPGASA